MNTFEVVGLIAIWMAVGAVTGYCLREFLYSRDYRRLQRALRSEPWLKGDLDRLKKSAPDYFRVGTWIEITGFGMALGVPIVFLLILALR